MPTRETLKENDCQVKTLPALRERTLHRIALSIDRKKKEPDRQIEEDLFDALLSSDTDLRRILWEVDQISGALKAEPTSPQSLRVASHPAVWCAMKQALLDRELRYLALTDDLTCLYNRRGFFAAATQQLRLARRNTQSMLLLFCDLDRFKEINDKHGHQEGDLALVRAADALAGVFRQADIVARLGGDEFAVLAVEGSSSSRQTMLRRLRQTLKDSNASEPRYELSFSVGVARFDPHSPVSLAELITAADRAMYEQKRGRAQLTPSA